MTPNITPLWELLDAPETTSAADIATLLGKRWRLGATGRGGEPLDPYVETFLLGQHASVVQSVYDELVQSAGEGAGTNLDLDHPVVGVVARLAGVELTAAANEGDHMASIGDVFRRGATTPVPPAGSEQVPASISDRLGLLAAYAVLPLLLAGSIGLALYFVPTVYERLSSASRSPSIVGNRVANVLDEANVLALRAGALLRELDAEAARSIQRTEPLWHRPKEEPVPAPVKAWLAPSVRTAEARRRQDQLILRYLALVGERESLAAGISQLLEDLQRAAPKFSAGSDQSDLFDAENLRTQANHYEDTAASLLQELAALHAEALSLKDS